MQTLQIKLRETKADAIADSLHSASNGASADDRKLSRLRIVAGRILVDTMQDCLRNIGEHFPEKRVMADADDSFHVVLQSKDFQIGIKQEGLALVVLVDDESVETGNKVAQWKSNFISRLAQVKELQANDWQRFAPALAYGA
jgi:hypothetical protein